MVEQCSPAEQRPTAASRRLAPDPYTNAPAGPRVNGQAAQEPAPLRAALVATAARLQPCTACPVSGATVAPRQTGHKGAAKRRQPCERSSPAPPNGRVLCLMRAPAAVFQRPVPASNWAPCNKRIPDQVHRQQFSGRGRSSFPFSSSIDSPNLQNPVKNETRSIKWKVKSMN